MAAILPFSPAATAAPVGEAAPRRPLLGQLLVDAGSLAPGALAEALAQQTGQDQRLGQILVANGLVSDASLGAALSRQSGIGQIDLAASPADPTLFAGIDPYRCLELEAVPWRQVGGTRVVAIGNPANAEAAMAACGGGAAKVALALAGPAEIRRTLTEAFAGRLRDDARARCPEAYSCRGWTETPRPARAVVLAAAALAATVAAPLVVLQLLMAWALLANAMTTGLRLIALFARARAGRVEPQHPGPRLADYKKLPRVSILVPLLREERVAQRLLDALAAMDYPAALLDIKLVLEDDDVITRAALSRAVLPRTVEVVSVPVDTLKTKPKAMNYALPFCRGDIVGVYDAEDRPDPGRSAPWSSACRPRGRRWPASRAISTSTTPATTGCRAASPSSTRSGSAWCCSGCSGSGLPIPLGGTSVFFRRGVLEQLGGWDAHNVTEDADLGMRLARFGYRCEMIPSTTWEEANCRVRPWIRQRSRWLKGYAVTWATHMRSPRALWHDLGAAGFVGFQVLFLGAITSYLALPLFWAALVAGVGFGLDIWGGLPAWLVWGVGASMLAGQAVMVATAVVAARDAARPGLLPWVAALPFYWPLGAVAAWRAIAEIFTRPTFWHKTEHGVSGA